MLRVGELQPFRVWAIDTSQPQLAVEGSQCCPATRARDPCMGKRGKRIGRRRRPRDTARETRRPPKRARCREAAAEEAVEEVNSSSSSSIDIASDPGSRTALSTARPITLFSGSAASGAASRPTDFRPRRRATEEADFTEEDLRVERSPEEFLAIAAALGRDYAVPATTSGDHRASSSYEHPVGGRATSSARLVSTPTVPNSGLPYNRRLLTARQGPVSSAEDTAGPRRRTWPAGALPPASPTPSAKTTDANPGESPAEGPTER